MLQREYDKARDDASTVAYRFSRLCEAPTPRPDALAEAAREMFMAAGRVAGFGTLLSRDLAPRGRP